MTEFPQSRISLAEGSSMLTYYTRKESRVQIAKGRATAGRAASELAV